MVTRLDSIYIWLSSSIILLTPREKMDANRAPNSAGSQRRSSGASIRHRHRGTSMTRGEFIYTPSAIQSPWAPSRPPAGPRPAHVGSHSLRWDLIMLRHRRTSTNTSSSISLSLPLSFSLTFVGSSENVGRDPSPSPARSRHYQTPIYPERTVISLLRITRTIEKCDRGW